MNNKKFKIYIIPIIAIALLTAFDQLTKFMVVSKFELYESIPVIQNVFNFTYIQNKGVAWGMFQGKRVIFLIITFFVLVNLFFIYNNISDNPKYKFLRVLLVVLTSGAIGNMIDRIKQGYVVDFLDFELINFPVFNVADIYVTVSMAFLLFLVIFKFKNDDFEEIITFKKKKAEIVDFEKKEVTDKDDFDNDTNLEDVDE